MSGYQPSHEEGRNPYTSYGPPPPESHPEGRIFTDLQHGVPQNINTLHTGHMPPQHGHHVHHSNHPPQYSNQYPISQAMDHPHPHQQPSHYGDGRGDMIQQGGPVHHGTGSKRPLPEDLGGMGGMGMGGMGGLPGQHMSSGMGGGMGGGMGSSMRSSQMMQQPYSQGTVQYHDHQMPGGYKRPRPNEESGQMPMGTPSMVGMEGMPEPAAKPRGPKLKFTADDDQLLVDLKENKSLTWKQIAEFFPGRSSGTLQVRYCTKLKAKTTQWTEETVQKLQTALHDYEQEKWRIVAQKVGTGFTSTACKEKAEELAGGVVHHDDDGDDGDDQS